MQHAFTEWSLDTAFSITNENTNIFSGVLFDDLFMKTKD